MRKSTCLPLGLRRAAGVAGPAGRGPRRNRNTICCCGAGTSSIRRTRSARSGTWPSPAGKVAAVAPRIDPAEAFKVVEVKGFYVTPGLVDIHTHVFTGTGEPNSYAGDNSVSPDGFTFRSGVTTVVDAGGSGWRNFPDFKTADHRSGQDPGAGVAQHRRPRHAGGQVRAGPGRHAGQADRRDGPGPQGPGGGGQDRALRRAGVGAGRAGGRGRHHRRHPGDGRLRRQPGRAAAGRAGDQEAAPGRHLHPRALGPAQGAGRSRAR